MNQNETLRAALQALLDMYVAGANSGDWGNWDVESEPQVIAARAALGQPAVPVVERADSATSVVERGAGNVSDNASTVAHAEPASEPALAPRLRWVEAPRRTEWGAGMMEALIAFGVDETLRLYAHRDAVPMVDALLSAQPAPARVPLTEAEIDEIFDADPPGASRTAQRRVARAIEAAHGITAQGEPK